MNIDESARSASLRRMLVDRVNLTVRTPRRSTARLAAVIAAVAVVSAGTGALSAAAIAQSTPYDDAVTASLAASVARANSTPVGQPHYVSQAGTASLDLGKMPAEATGLAIRTECTEPGTIDVHVDGSWVSSVTCNSESPTGGGGGVVPVTGQGSHTAAFTSQGTGYQAWVVWVKEPPLPTASAQQDAEMADGTITREEYLAAFNRFVGCMSGAGYDIMPGDSGSTIIRYAIPSAAHSSGADELCYVTQFGDVDMTWQVQNESLAK